VFEAVLDALANRVGIANNVRKASIRDHNLLAIAGSADASFKKFTANHFSPAKKSFVWQKPSNRRGAATNHLLVRRLTVSPGKSQTPGPGSQTVRTEFPRRKKRG